MHHNEPANGRAYDRRNLKDAAVPGNSVGEGVTRDEGREK